jgi:hypothetical protein
MHPLGVACAKAAGFAVRRGWSRRRYPSGTPNLLHNPHYHLLGILEHLRVREPQHAIPFLPHPPIPPRIAFRLQVVRMAVQFDHQPQFPAEEVGKERPGGHLAAEFHAELRAREMAPQDAPRRRRLAAELAGACGVAGPEQGHEAGIAPVARELRVKPV